MRRNRSVQSWVKVCWLRCSTCETANLYSSLQRQIEERRAAQASLQQANLRKDEFLAMLSHELRNPRAAIHTALQWVRWLAAPEAERRCDGPWQCIGEGLHGFSRRGLGRPHAGTAGRGEQGCMARWLAPLPSSAASAAVAGDLLREGWACGRGGVSRFQHAGHGQRAVVHLLQHRAGPAGPAQASGCLRHSRHASACGPDPATAQRSRRGRRSGCAPAAYRAAVGCSPCERANASSRARVPVLPHLTGSLANTAATAITSTSSPSISSSAHMGV